MPMALCSSTSLRLHPDLRRVEVRAAGGEGEAGQADAAELLPLAQHGLADKLAPLPEHGKHR